MKRRSKAWVCVAVAALLASSTAMAALNKNAVRLATTSLRLSLVKASVADAILSSMVLPANNAQAHLGPANQLTTNEISAILVSSGAVINVYLTPAVGVTGGVLELVPQVVTNKDGKKAVEYTCYSPNIPDIATAAPDCTYHAAVK